MKQGSFFPQFLIVVLAALASITFITYHNITQGKDSELATGNLPIEILHQYREGNNILYYHEITGQLAACTAMKQFLSVENHSTIRAWLQI